MTLLALDNVARSFGRTMALSRLSLALAPAERVALLGHNGAGKTTLFRLVLGFIRAETGTIRIAGAAPGSRAARAAVAYLPESVSFPRALTGREVIALYARLKGVPAAEAGRALERVGLGAAAHRRVGTYSKGMRQRLGLAQALIGRPRLLLLDEPTSGLDPHSRRDFYAFLDEAVAGGTAFLLASHSLEEVESRTDRVAILSAGRLVADAPLAELTARAGLPVRIRVRVATSEPGGADAIAGRLGGARVNGRSVELLCAGCEKMDRIAAIGALGGLVSDVEVETPGLDAVYRHYVDAAPESAR